MLKVRIGATWSRCLFAGSGVPLHDDTYDVDVQFYCDFHLYPLQINREKREVMIMFRRIRILRGLSVLLLTTLALSMAVLGNTQVSAGETTPPEIAASLEGHVQAVHELGPVAGALVQVIGLTIEPVFTTETDLNGHYSFDALPPATYEIRVMEDGFHPASEEIVLESGEHKELNFSLLTITGEISGFVYNDESGVPVVGALVFIFHPILDNNEPWIWDRTNEYGFYELPGVPPGTYPVFVRHAEYEPDSNIVDIHPGQVTYLNFPLTPKPSAEPGGIGGTVVDAETGLPIAEAVIQIDGFHTFAPILTDDDGRYEVHGIPAGLTVVHAFKEGYFHACQEVDIPSGGFVEVNFALRPLPVPGAIEGTVYDGQTEGPIAGAKIFYRRLGPNPDPATDTSLDPNSQLDPDVAWPHVTTNDSGNYRIGGLHPGVYALLAKADGYYHQWKRVVVESDGVTVAYFKLRPKVPHESGWISGHVINALTGDPVGGARVFFAPLGEDGTVEWSDAPDVSHPHVHTDDNGFYRTPELRLGPYVVLVRKRGFELQRGLAEVISGEVTRLDFELVPLPSDTGQIEGRVIDALTGQPLAGVPVFYAPADPTGNIPEGSATILPWDNVPDVGDVGFPHVLTDENGQFRIAHLRPGTWSLNVRAPGYEPQSKLVQVYPAETTHVEFLMVPDPDPERGAIAGRVIDAELNTPIAGAWVFWAPLDGTPGGGTDPGTNLLPFIDPETDPWDFQPPDGSNWTRTGPNGCYEIPNLASGGYILLAWAFGYFPQHQQADVHPGDVTIVNFELDPINSPEPGAIAGKVVDAETGDPVGGAWIFYERVHDLSTTPGWFDAAGIDIPHVRTNNAGEYEIRPLRHGLYHLVVRAEQYHPAHANVQVNPGEVTTANYELIPWREPEPGWIEGHVYNAKTGEPIAGALVQYGPLHDAAGNTDWWRDSNEDGTIPGTPHVRTDDSGQYVLPELRPGHYYLRVNAEGFHPQYRRTIVEPGETTTEDFELRPGDPTEPGAIAGQVFDAASGDPLAGARVFYQPIGDPQELDERSNDLSANGVVVPTDPPFVETDDNGEYKIENLRPGRWHLIVEAEGHHPEARVVGVHSGQTTIADFRLFPRVLDTGSVRGRVIDPRTQEPIEGAHVVVLPGGDIVIADIVPAIIYGEATTNGNGEYAIGQVPVGPVKVCAWKERYRRQCKRAFVYPLETTEVNFALHPVPMDPFGALVGSVHNAHNEQPIHGALVVLLPDDHLNHDLSRVHGHLRHTFTDRNGHYAFRRVPAGGYTVIAAHPRFRPARQHARIHVGEISEAHFLLEPRINPNLGSLGGVVQDALTGQPIAGAWVAVKGDEHDWIGRHCRRWTRTNENGEYLFGRLPADLYKVYVCKRGYHEATAEATVHPGERTQLNFELQPVVETGVLEGIVRDALTEQPIHQALVVVPLTSAPNGTSQFNALWALTDEQGHYRIAGVPAGLRVVFVLHRGYFPDAQLAWIIPGQVTELDFDLIPWPISGDGPIDIRVIDRNTGEPVEGVQLSVSTNDWIAPCSDWNPFTAITDANGWAVLDGLPAGQWPLIASIDGHDPATIMLPDLSEAGLDLDADGNQSGKGNGGGISLTIELEGDSQFSSAGRWELYY
jgi:uncharacterized GH25 family protein